MTNFADQVIDQAKKLKKTIVLPEGNDERTIAASKIILDKQFANIIVLGNRDKLKPWLDKYGVNPDAIHLTDPAGDPQGQELASMLYELRKDKGMTPEKAKEIIRDEMYFGTMLIKKGLADGLVSGACHSTADTLRPALQLIKPAKGIKTVSSMFFMCWPNKTLLFADCGLLEDPTEDQLADIAVTTAATAIQFGFQPRIAMLSYSSKGSASGPNAKKVANASVKAIAAIKSVYGDKVIIDGELQFDAAYVPSIAAKKAPNSPLKGSSNTFIFPDLGAGNICYKSTQRLAGCEAYGPVVQGLARPVNDLSRGCNVEDIVVTTAITAIQAAG